MNNETVAAIATAYGVAGVGIIRISGLLALNIANKMFSKPLNQSHKMVYGSVVRGDNIIDKALACFFKAPNSYTGEDIIEFHCHGGMTVCKMVLETALLHGAALAPPGEFTRRAFLNGRLDLAQAEAVGDLIEAKTEDAAFVAANHLEGKLSKKISEARSKLLDITAHLTATFDFPDEMEDYDGCELTLGLNQVKSIIDNLLATADDGFIVRDGVNAAIIGAPNVGKSSFLNLLTGHDRAIVSDIEGTTRDVIEVSVNIRGCRINLLDTAGIRQSSDFIEQLGVKRSIDALNSADIIFLILDGTRELNEDDKQIISLISGKDVVCLINKCDLPQKIIPPHFDKIINISALTGTGIEYFF